MSSGGQLRLFLDRSVGTRKIAAALHEAELDIETIVDRYGDEAPRVTDDRWITDATTAGRLLKVAPGWPLAGARPSPRRSVWTTRPSAAASSRSSCRNTERVRGIEPPLSAWELHKIIG
jgi:hypothetical protein